MTKASESPSVSGGARREAMRVVRDAAIIAALTAVAALVINLFHPESIPYVAERPYEILVPCPEGGGVTAPLAADAPELTTDSTFIVDARSAEAFAAFRFGAAVNVTYDFLDATPPEVLADLAKRIAGSRAQRVAVYGDGGDPDTGEELAIEISGYGIKNVFFVRGGAPALRARSVGGGER